MRDRLCSALVMLLLLTGIVHAQETDSQADAAPLIAFFNGDMYTLDGDALVSYETCQTDEAMAGIPDVSPDGTRFVFSTLTAQTTQFLRESGGFGDAPLPVNFWLCNTAEDTLTRFFAAQGADDPYTGEFPEVDALRGSPVWSPDGSQLAWAELDANDNAQGSIVIYDIASDTQTTTSIEVPPAMGIPSAPGITWGENGIYIFIFSLNEETFAAEENIYVFDPDAGEITQQTLIDSGTEQDDFVVERLRMSDDDGEFFGYRFFENGWQRVDPLTGEREPLNGLPQMVARNADDSQALLVDLDRDYNYNWQLADYNDDAGQPFVQAGAPPPRITLSPDGGAVAYADSSLHIWRDGEVRDIANSDGYADDAQAYVLWGAVEYVIGEAESIADAPLPTCDGMLVQSRLRPDDEGRVVAAGVPNNVRDNPSVQAALVGQLPGGAAFDVLEGPVCNDGYAWYRVSYDDLDGWTAEGTGNQYWLEPIASEG